MHFLLWRVCKVIRSASHIRNLERFVRFGPSLLDRNPMEKSRVPKGKFPPAILAPELIIVIARCDDALTSICNAKLIGADSNSLIARNRDDVVMDHRLWR